MARDVSLSPAPVSSKAPKSARSKRQPLFSDDEGGDHERSAREGAPTLPPTFFAGSSSSAVPGLGGFSAPSTHASGGSELSTKGKGARTSEGGESGHKKTKAKRKKPKDDGEGDFDPGASLAPTRVQEKDGQKGEGSSKVRKSKKERAAKKPRLEFEMPAPASAELSPASAKVPTTKVWVELPSRPGSGKKRKLVEADADEQDAPRKEAKKKGLKGTVADAPSVGAAKVTSKELISDSEDEAKEPANNPVPATVRNVAAQQMEEEEPSSLAQTRPAARGTPRKGAMVKVCPIMRFGRLYIYPLFRKMRLPKTSGNLPSQTL